MQVYIVRHGQSTGNISTEDIPDGDLTPLGEQQAREVAARLAGENLTHVLCSPLVRALGTATAVATAAGIEKIEVWPEMQETRREIHRGHGREVLLQRFPLAVLADSVEAEGWPHGGESYETGLERAAEALAAIRAHYGRRDRLALVSHGAFINFLLRALLHMPPSRGVWFTMNNCGITRVRLYAPGDPPVEGFFPAEAELLGVNDTSHISQVS